MKLPQPVVLAIDIGTSSVRAMLFDGTGSPVPAMRAVIRHSLHVADDGAAEANADELFERIGSCLDQLLATTGAGTTIAAVGISTFAGTLLGVDRAGTPVTPVITYADTRSVSQVAELRREVDEGALHQRTGCRLHTGYWPAQLRWIAAERPDWLAGVEQWITLGDYFQRRLLHRPGSSYSAAAWSGLLNRHSLTWDDALLALLPVTAARLAPLVDLDDANTQLQPRYARRWPALQAAHWLPAVGDGATANLGSDCASPDRVALTVGTTSAMRVVTEAVATVPEGLWCYRVDRPRALVGGALTEGGNLFAWARRTLRLTPDAERLEARLAAMTPDGHGLTFLPLLGGERAPGWRADLRGAVAGLSLTATPVEILRAGLEGVALRIGQIYTRLTPLLGADATVVASGGALLHSHAWLQIMADVLGRPVQPSPVEEASARGAALLALTALGVNPPPLPLNEAVVLPDAAAHACYREASARQQALYAWLAESKESPRSCFPGANGS